MLRYIHSNYLVAPVLFLLVLWTYDVTSAKHYPTVKKGALSQTTTGLSNELQPTTKTSKFTDAPLHDFDLPESDLLETDLTNLTQIQGEVEVIITPHSATYFSETFASVSVTGPLMEDLVLDGQQSLQFQPKNFGRGFYIEQCDETKGDLQFQFTGHNNQTIELDNLWVRTNQSDGCEVNRVRGVQSFMLNIETGKANAGTVKVFEEMWVLDHDYMMFFYVIAALVSLTQLNGFCRLLSQKNLHRTEALKSTDDFENIVDVVDEEGATRPDETPDETVEDDNFKQDQSQEKNKLRMFSILNTVWNITVQLLKAIAKILYLAYVAKYNGGYSLGLQITFFLPIILLFATAICCRQDASLGQGFRIACAILLNVDDQMHYFQLFADRAAKYQNFVQFIFLVENSLWFILVLFNNVLMCEDWSWLQFILPILVVHSITSSFFKRGEDMSPIKVAIMTLCNLYILSISLYFTRRVFHTDDRPAWAKEMPKIGIGHTWIYSALRPVVEAPK